MEFPTSFCLLCFLNAPGPITRGLDSSSHGTSALDLTSLFILGWAPSYRASLHKATLPLPNGTIYCAMLVIFQLSRRIILHFEASVTDNLCQSHLGHLIKRQLYRFRFRPSEYGYFILH